MCARRPTSAMPKPFLCCERAFCCSMVVMWPVLMHVMSFDVVVMSFDAMWLLVLCHVTWCNAMSCDVPCNGHVVCSKWFCDNAVIQSTILYYKVLLCTTKYYSSTILYYTVLQRTTPVLLCTTKYFSSTTLYCKVLLQYYSSTTLYYKVLLQYYSVLQSTTPVLLCTTKYYSSTILYYKAAFMIDPWHIWTVIYMIDVRRIWNVIYNARSNRSHPPTSPNTAPATQNDCDDWSTSHMKRHLQCAEQQESQSNFTKYCACHAKWISWLIRVTYETSFTMRGATNFTPQLHQILRLPRKMNLMIDPRHIWNVIYNARSKQSHPPTSPNTAPATKSASSRFQRKLREVLPPIERRFEDNPRIIRPWNRHLAPAASETFLVPPWRRILYGKIQHFAFRLSIEISPSAAPATKSNTPTSPNTAPATQNESHDWSASHMKRHLQCAEQQTAHHNFTKYFACHAKWISWLIY